MLMYPKVAQEAETIFLLGIFMELVDREVVGKQKELLVGTVTELPQNYTSLRAGCRVEGWDLG